MSVRIQVFQDEGAEYRFRLKAANGEIVLSSEGYTSESDAIKAAHRAVELMDEASIEAPE